MSAPAKERLTLENRPRRGDVLGLKDVPTFQAVVLRPYDDIGKVSIDVDGVPLYGNLTELIQAGVIYLHRKRRRA